MVLIDFFEEMSCSKSKFCHIISAVLQSMGDNGLVHTEFDHHTRILSEMENESFDDGSQNKEVTEKFDAKQFMANFIYTITVFLAITAVVLIGIATYQLCKHLQVNRTVVVDGKTLYTKPNYVPGSETSRHLFPTEKTF